MTIKVEIHIPEHVIITADDAKVVITRKGIRSFANRGQNGDQTIPLTNIIGVDFKKAGVTAGQINFITAAGNQTTGGLGALPGFAHGAYNKANNVVFRGGSNNKDMEKLKTFVENNMGPKNLKHRLLIPLMKLLSSKSFLMTEQSLRKNSTRRKNNYWAYRGENHNEN